MDGGGTLVINGANAIDALDNGTNNLLVGESSELGMFGTVISAGADTTPPTVTSSAAVPEPGSLALLLAAAGIGGAFAATAQ